MANTVTDQLQFDHVCNFKLH